MSSGPAPGAGPATAPEERVPLTTKLAFGLPSIAGAAIAIPITVHMPKFYSDDVLVPLGWLAIGIAIARAFDAITDPVMGWLSDRTRTRWGRRKPWIAVGVPLCAVALIALFTPPAQLGPPAAALWFGTSFVLYFLFHTVYDVPHYGLGAELTLDYNERSSLFGVRAGFILLGVLVGVSLPGAIGTAAADARGTFFTVSSIFAATLVVSYAVLLWRVRERPEFATREASPLVPGVRRALRNRPFRTLLLTYGISSIPGAIPGTLIPFYTEYVLQPDDPDRWIVILLATYFVSGSLFLLLWIPLARRIGKLPVWLICFGIGITGGPPLFLIGPGDEWWAVALLAYTGAQFGAGFFLGPAMQADVIDYDELHTGKRREAQFGAFWGIVTKLIVIPSAAVPLAILGAMGYVPNVAQTPAVIMTIKWMLGIAPSAFALLALPVAWRYPISESVHREILAGIAAHARGEVALDPITGDPLPPPANRGVDEATGWRLDYFTRAELRGWLTGGPRALRGQVTRKAAAWCLAALAMSAAAAGRIRALGSELAHTDNLLITGLVVASGMLIAASLFQLLRIRPVRELADSGVTLATVERWLSGTPGAHPPQPDPAIPEASGPGPTP